MTTGQSLAEGAAGVALLHLETGDRMAAFTALEEAAADGVTIADNASLYYGSPAFGFVLATSSWPELARARAVAADGTAAVTRRKLEAANRRIDQRRRPDYAEYDLIRGLTGLGVALRRIGNLDLLHDVLTYLVRLTEPMGSLPGWWCRNGPSRDQPDPAGGHSNHGLAHGITGPLSLLALTHLDGLHVDGQTDAISRVLSWLDIWEQQTIAGSVWWPQTLIRTDLERGALVQRGPGRPSWCYGTPGIARALQLAARAVGDTARQRRVETAFTACISDPAQTGRFIDRGLCHGTAGLLATSRRIAADALAPISLEHLQTLHHTTATANEPAGLLDGRAGAELAVTGTTTAWDALLLLC
ncbi:lanthionine synthetase C family protein [Promicromonospora sp. NPDC057138]|uniref:lanthionine synthetase C family protein n=1 Tax=Promicromonospora sp. NPDC057138 TaxID=3346031 RepID=UPI0036430A1B